MPPEVGVVHAGPLEGPATCTSQQIIPAAQQVAPQHRPEHWVGELQGAVAHAVPSQYCVLASHFTPHAPQLSRSLRSFTHVPPQHESPSAWHSRSEVQGAPPPVPPLLLVVVPLLVLVLVLVPVLVPPPLVLVELDEWLVDEDAPAPVEEPPPQPTKSPIVIAEATRKMRFMGNE